MYNRTIKIIRTLVGHEKMSSVELMDKLKISQKNTKSRNKKRQISFFNEKMFSFIHPAQEDIM